MSKVGMRNLHIHGKLIEMRNHLDLREALPTKNSKVISLLRSCKKKGVLDFLARNTRIVSEELRRI